MKKSKKDPINYFWSNLNHRPKIIENGTVEDSAIFLYPEYHSDLPQNLITCSFYQDPPT